MRSPEQTCKLYICPIKDIYSGPYKEHILSLGILAGQDWHNGIVLASQLSDPGSMPSPSNQGGLWGLFHASIKNILALKLMGRFIRSKKQRVLVVPLNGPWSNKNLFLNLLVDLITTNLPTCQFDGNLEFH